MTDPELDVVLRALTEVDRDPRLAERVLARLERPARTGGPVPWLAAAAAVLVAAVGTLSWYAGRPLVMPRLPDGAPMAQARPLGVPHVPDHTLTTDASGPPIVPASFRSRLTAGADRPWPSRIPAMGRTPALAIDPIGDAPLGGTRLDIAPLEIVEIVIPSLKHQ